MSEREIKTIGFGRAARDRLGMYLSAEPSEALALGLREIYVNSLDALTETKAANGLIKITINTAKRSVLVVDNGPGIPNKIRDDGLDAVVAAYTMAHTGSHFDGREVNSIGLNGIGASVVTHTASEFRVASRDGTNLVEAFFIGTPEGAELNLRGGRPDKGHGVEVEYTPDKAVYGDAWFNEKELIDALTEMMKFYPKVKMEISFDGRVTKLSYPNGLKEKGTQIYYESESLILALGTGDGYIKPFGNRLHLPDGGGFFTHFKTQLTRTVNDLSGLKLSGAQVQAVFSGYVAVFVSNPLFSNQSKTAISNKEVNTEITMAVKQKLEEFSKTGEWERTIKALETEMKAEAAAERARQKVKEGLDAIKKGSKSKLALSDKLKDCINAGSGTYLAICEGRSALGGLLQGRNIENVALYPIRGKLINCLKSQPDKFLQNQEVQEIAQALGAGILDTFKCDKMKYENVVFITDADVDADHIKILLLTFFAVCMPEALKRGKIWIAEGPLYMRGEDEFIFTEEDWLKLKGSKKGFTRAKGIGEMTPKQVENSIFGKYRRWVQIKTPNMESFLSRLDVLMDSGINERRKEIFEKVDFSNITFL